MNVCKTCLRAAQKHAHAEQMRHINAIRSRSLLTTSTRYQRQPNPSPSTSQSTTIPPPIPITTPTATSNITADVAAQLQSQKNTIENGPEPSTAEMQKRIQTNLRPQPLVQKIAVRFANVAKSTANTYMTYGVTEAMLKSCTAQAAYTIPEDQRAGIYTGQGPPKNSREEDLGIPEADNSLGQGAESWWFKELGLEPTFSTWAHVSMLHMYILTVRMRALPTEKEFREHQRYLLEHFSAEAEIKMELLHNLSSRTVRNKYLKDLFSQWRGALYAYDEGLVKGDAVLAATVWRNLWKADENVDWNKVALVVAYMRRCIYSLADESLQNIAAAMKENSAFWQAANQGLDATVERKSPELSKPL